MSIRLTRTMLWLLALCLLALAGWVAFEAPRPRESHASITSSSQAVATGSGDEGTSRARPTLAEFASHLDRDLQAPLYDPPPAPTAAAEPKGPAAPALTAKLIATMVEPGRSQAVLDIGGSTERVGVGDVVEGATVLQITPGTVVLQREGERITLALPERSQAAAPQPSGRRP